MDLSVLRGVPVQKILLKLFIRNLDQSFTKSSLSFIVGKGDWGTAFNLGNVYLLAGRIHKEINGIQHS